MADRKCGANGTRAPFADQIRSQIEGRRRAGCPNGAQCNCGDLCTGSSIGASTVLIVGNYGIGKNRVTRRWPAERLRFVLVLQSTCGTWGNVIDRRCHAMHDTAIQNSHCPASRELSQSVGRFLEAIRSFSVTGHAVAHPGLTVREDVAGGYHARV